MLLNLFIVTVYALQRLDQKFDFFHIDGHHDNNYIKNEFLLVKNLNNSLNNNILRVIFDDQACLLELQYDIIKNYNIIHKIIPNCEWNNIYFEIQL